MSTSAPRRTSSASVIEPPFTATGASLGEEIAQKVLQFLQAGAATSVPTIQVWLLELFVRGCFSIDHKNLTKAVTGHTLTQRHSFIVRGLNGDVNFFRKNKTRFEELNGFEKHHFMIGATCLPKDEFINWVGAVKPNLDRPLDARFCDWVKTKTGQLETIVEARIRP